MTPDEKHFLHLVFGRSFTGGRRQGASALRPSRSITAIEASIKAWRAPVPSVSRNLCLRRAKNLEGRRLRLPLEFGHS